MEAETNTQKGVQKKRSSYRMDEKQIRPFDRAYDQLKINEAQSVKKVICDLCDLSDAYFSMKKSGKRGVTFYEESVIRATFQCFGIDAFTGEPIKIN